MTTTFLVLFGTLVLVSHLILGSTFDILHEHLHNVDKPDLDKLDIAQTGQPTEELCQFWGPFGAIQITDQSLISSNWSLIEFKLKLRTNETIFSVELHNTTEPKGYFQPKPTFTITPQMHFKSMETFGSFYYNQIAYDAILHQVNISIGPPQVAFAVWDIKVDHKTRITKRQVSLNYHWELPGASSIASTYLVKSWQIGQAYIKYTFDDLENSSSNREYCFQLARTSHPQMVIEVYANLFGVNQFKKIVIRSEKPFFTVTPMAILMDSNFTSSIVVVDLKNADNDAVNSDGLFRVGYMLELKETLKDIILMYTANFENITQFGSENCHKGPTYADLDCHKHVYQCPDYYFSYDPIAKTCTRNDAPRHQ